MNMHSIRKIVRKRHLMTFIVKNGVWFSYRKFNFDHRNLRKISSDVWNANRAKIPLQRNKNILILFHRLISENRVKQKQPETE